ncbi:MAG: hypothetical protein WAV15_00300 [Minisyncoccia bacterium]
MQEKNKTTLWIIVGLVVLALLGYWLYQARKSSDDSSLFLTSFEDCVAAGYPVMETYPRQCQAPDGIIYVEDVNTEEPSTAVAKDGCYIGGCSSQLCSGEPGVMSTCEYKPEYSCYKSGVCERQSGGECGWTATSALQQCLSAKGDTLLK